VDVDHGSSSLDLLFRAKGRYGHGFTHGPHWMDLIQLIGWPPTGASHMGATSPARAAGGYLGGPVGPENAIAGRADTSPAADRAAAVIASRRVRVGVSVPRARSTLTTSSSVPFGGGRPHGAHVPGGFRVPPAQPSRRFGQSRNALM